MAFNVLLDQGRPDYRVFYNFGSDDFTVDYGSHSMVIKITEDEGIAPVVVYRLEGGALNVMGGLLVEVDGALYDGNGSIFFSLIIDAIEKKYGGWL